MPVGKGTVYESLAAGFSPPGRNGFSGGALGRGVQNQANMAALYSPGSQVDQTVTSGPWDDEAGRAKNLKSPAFKVWWPACPVFGVGTTAMSMVLSVS